MTIEQRYQLEEAINLLSAWPGPEDITYSQTISLLFMVCGGLVPRDEIQELYWEHTAPHS